VVVPLIIANTDLVVSVPSRVAANRWLRAARVEFSGHER
jgi:hypothetical protein